MAELFVQALIGAGHVRRVRHVDLDPQRGPTQLTQPGERLRRGPGVEHGDPASRRREPQRDALADALGAAGDGHYPVIECHRRSCG